MFCFSSKSKQSLKLYDIEITDKKKEPIDYVAILLSIMGFLLVVMQSIIGLCQVLQK